MPLNQNVIAEANLNLGVAIASGDNVGVRGNQTFLRDYEARSITSKVSCDRQHQFNILVHTQQTQMHVLNGRSGRPDSPESTAMFTTAGNAFSTASAMKFRDSTLFCPGRVSKRVASSAESTKYRIFNMKISTAFDTLSYSPRLS